MIAMYISIGQTYVEKKPMKAFITGYSLKRPPVQSEMNCSDTGSVRNESSDDSLYVPYLKGIRSGLKVKKS